MTPEEVKQAWQDMPKAMRNDIISLYDEHWITVNTRRRLERIFGAENLNLLNPKQKKIWKKKNLVRKITSRPKN